MISMYDLMKSGISYEDLLEDLNKAKNEIDKERAAVSKEKKQAEKLRLAEACVQSVFDYFKVDMPELDIEMTDDERKIMANAFMSLMDQVVEDSGYLPDFSHMSGMIRKPKTNTKPAVDPIDTFLHELNLK